jgi:ribosomal protein S18 acetylase RimI-like enzyme
VVLDHHRAPDHEELADALDRARRRGYHRARTSALFPVVTPVFLAAGFAPIDTLALLRCELLDDASSFTDATATATPSAMAPRRRRGDRRGSGDTTSLVAPPPVRLRALRRRHHRVAAQIDLLAFGDPWANDATSLGEIRHATPIHHAVRSVEGRRTTGFAITGLAGDTGYLQRLAVHPDHHRHGIGTALVADAMTWIRECGAGTVMVNTGIDNHAALALYRRFGFHELAQRLTIAELDLRPDHVGTSS